MNKHVPPPMGGPDDFIRRLTEVVEAFNVEVQRAERIETMIAKWVRRYLWLVSANTIVFGANMAVMIFYILLRLRMGGP